MTRIFQIGDTLFHPIWEFCRYGRLGDSILNLLLNVIFQSNKKACQPWHSRCLWMWIMPISLPPHHTSHAISQKAPLQRTVIFLQVSGSECLIFSLLPNGLSAALIFRQLHEYYLILESNVFLPLFWPKLVGSLVNFVVISVRGKNLAWSQTQSQVQLVRTVWWSPGPRRYTICIVNLLGLVWRVLWEDILEIHRLT